MYGSAFHALLLADGTRRSDQTAILDEAGAKLTFAGLAAGIDTIRRQLAAAGLGAGDRVALLAPDGPDLALLFLGTTAQATAVPLNPRGDPDALAGFLADAGARALVSPSGNAFAADLAGRANIALFSLRGSAFEPGGLILEAAAPSSSRDVSEPGAGDVAYVLGTAGTTGRSKVLPITHAMVGASCRAMAEWLGLGPADRCLNPMPLFHSHGLLNGVIWPLAAGGSTICPRRFDPASLPVLLARLHPTWVTAVPAILRAMATAMRHALPRTEQGHLRFVRSSSAPLPPELFDELARVFGAPVIETYGLTETGPLTTSPLAPGGQKPGKAGLPCGPEVRILDANGRPVGPGVTGEIVARGPTVAREYESNPTATAEAFRDGWFHTGDLGRLDEDGYLVVGGRMKEIIRRGGEGIAPLDVDRVLASHPAVVDCACFPIPHPTLGEEVGAAVVLASGSGVTAEEIREHAAGRLPGWMVPRAVRVVDRLPRSPAGKVIRRTLAAHLGLDAPQAPAGAAAAATPSGPLSPVETALLALWQAALGRPVPTLDTDFGLAGGDSLSAVNLAGSVNEVFGTSLALESPLVEGRTVARMRDLILAERGVGSPHAGIDAPDRVPATPGQRRQWLHSLTQRDAPVNVISSALLLKGPLDRARLRRAADAVARRHDALRLSFSLESGEAGRVLLQRVDSEAAWPVEEDGPVPRGALGGRLAAAVQRPFALAGGPPRRLVLVPVSDEADTHGLAVALHHAIADGWSKEIVLRDLARAYAEAGHDGMPELPPAASWMSALRWRQEHPAGDDVLRATRERLSDLVPTGVPGSAEPADWRARRCRLTLPAAVTETLHALARAHRVTLFSILLAAFADAMGAVLSPGRTPVVVGVPLGNRRPEETDAVGPYSNATLIAVDTADGRGLADRLAAVQASVLEAVSRQGIPIEVATEAGGPGAWKHAAMELPVLFQLQAYPRFEQAQAGPLRFERIPFDSGIAQADLSVEIAEEGGALSCDFVIRQAKETAAVVHNVATRFAEKLSRLHCSPGEHR